MSAIIRVRRVSIGFASRSCPPGAVIAALSGHGERAHMGASQGHEDGAAAPPGLDIFNVDVFRLEYIFCKRTGVNATSWPQSHACGMKGVVFSE